MNRRKTALSADELREKFPKGIKLHQVKKGVALVSNRDAEKSAEQLKWWGNLEFLIGSVTIMPDDRSPKWLDLEVQLNWEICQVDSSLPVLHLRG